MKVRYLLIALAIFSGNIYAVKGTDEKYVRSELHRILEQTDAKSLSLNDVRKVHSLIRDLEKIDKKSADHIKMQHIEIQYGCCEYLSEFRQRDVVLEIKDAFDNPQPKDHKWKQKVERLLDLCYKFGPNDDCGEPVEPLLTAYKQYKERYNKLVGRAYKPKPVKEALSQYATEWYAKHGG